MKLSKAQEEWVREEQKTLRRIIASDPKTGLIGYQIQLRTLNLIVNLHNIEVEAELARKK